MVFFALRTLEGLQCLFPKHLDAHGFSLTLLQHNHQKQGIYHWYSTVIYNPYSHFANCPSNVLYDNFLFLVQDPQRVHILFLIVSVNLSVNKTTVSVISCNLQQFFSLSPAFMTLTFEKNTGQLFYRMSLSLGSLHVSSWLPAGSSCLAGAPQKRCPMPSEAP